MKFCKFHEKLTRGIFLNFCLKLPVHKVLRLTKIIFLGEKIGFEKNGTKMVSNDYSIFMKN